MALHVEESFWSLFPEAVIAVVVVHGLDNRNAAPKISARFDASVARTAAAFEGADFANHEVIAPWRRAYQAFGAKPAKFRSSIEALIRSAVAGRLGAISPLVDLYNAISLDHFLPAGGEDLAKIEGDLVLTRAAGTEEFVPLGSVDNAPPAAGEVIYRDDRGVVCRCWNWREADRTKLTAETENAVLVLEALGEIGRERLVAAAEDLAATVREIAASVRVEILDASRPRVSLD